ncbi:metalloregulator ArsR/SmtB family transcription factor [uncultured Hoeflea sp.]|uniref:ArsR/SmtB family transcription factor n=1 Tax=uncultured Hoeflea sp. TaxID=538666 RepID=UPI0030ECB046|tara:strand:- start:22740 stop:23111 length:372 start_codon:yes stop_codon:yes gene_type:complete
MTGAAPGQDFNGQDITLLAGQARKASDILKALSHETRLLILWLLSENEKSVSELEQLLALPQAAVSQQLARLRYDNLVSTRREGRIIHYSIADPDVSAVVTSLYTLLCDCDGPEKTRVEIVNN